MLRFRDAPGSSESGVSCSHPNTSVREKGKEKAFRVEGME